MTEEFEYTEFKTIVNKWNMPFIYCEETKDVVLMTLVTVPTFKTSVTSGSANHTDFINTMKASADNLCLYDANRIPMTDVNSLP